MRIDGTDSGPSARGIAPVKGRNLRFLNASGIGQHVGTKIDSTARSQNTALETLPGQLGQQSAVVNMRMRQKRHVNIGGVERERPIVQLLESLLPLE